MPQNIKFSIIIPVYNVEEYLAECIDSILSQDYNNIQILCINDGSTDNSLKLLEKYAQKDRRIKIFSQKNQGQGIARNVGIKNATGDYIMFIDPDDWILPNTLKKLANYIEKYKPIVVQFLYKILLQKNKQYSKKNFFNIIKRKFGVDLYKKDNYSFDDIPQNIFLSFYSSSVDKCYKTSFLKENNIYFLPHRNGEDTLFVLKILLCTKQIDLLKENLYVYRIRENSSSTASYNKNTLFIFEQIKYVKDLLIEHHLFTQMEKWFIQYKLRTIYEGDKKCSKEFIKEFLILAKKNLSFYEYYYFILQKYISILLRGFYSMQKGITQKDGIYNCKTILGIKIWKKLR